MDFVKGGRLKNVEIQLVVENQLKVGCDVSYRFEPPGKLIITLREQGANGIVLPPRTGLVVN